jgi:large subunit ribosomal protein L10
VDKSKKEAVVSLLKDDFSSAKAVFVTDFKSLPVSAMVSLRDRVRQTGGQYRVVKNTLVKLASRGQSAEKLTDLLVGNNGLGLTWGDPAAMAKVLQDFAKEENKFAIKGGLLGAQTLSPAQIQALASLPSREVLLSSFLGALQAVPASLARALAAVPQKLLYALTAVRDQKAEG